ncbi:hypothetical protein [Pseudohalocynthiibacter sp. F2068]|jgi:hypothetical protein|uniref:hypothetical protein n=1 Tax=Pseudohalocynthiibacter sp. F2068 TaxID=2926418 RepID=UPI001FF33258|nr:hypothetical protein [Pseudohalocynthiibacter sp. F2068]MCK0102540.1 hypothetical protein [Pseudohalocynthiibacter sp. F2068]
MSIDRRLSILEKLAKQAHGKLSNKPNAKQQLLKLLNVSSARLKDVQPTEEWCARSSNAQIVAMGLNELESGKRSPVLWRRISDSAKLEGPVGTIFTELEARHGS